MASQINTILDTLQTELEEHIKVSRGYNTDLAECKQGIHEFEEMLNRPATNLHCNENGLEEQLMSRIQLRILKISINYYTDSKEVLFELIEDVESFLSNTSVYKSNMFLGNVFYYIGGISDPIAIARQEITIKFTREL